MAFEHRLFRLPVVPMIPKAGGRRRSIAVLTSTMHGSFRYGVHGLHTLNSTAEADSSKLDEEDAEEKVDDELQPLNEEVAGDRGPALIPSGSRRRRACNTSDLRSCAMVQSKLKSGATAGHRNSWKPIASPSSPLYVYSNFGSNK